MIDSSIIFDRKHRFLKEREFQLRMNREACEGGKKYINDRLWRACNESDLSWNGCCENGVYIVGRKDRTVYINDAQRVAQKIEQYIFSEETVREGAKEDFISNVTGDGIGIDAFMQNVCREITIGQWCWIQVCCDGFKDSTGNGRTLEERNESGDCVRWVLYPSLSVVDWKLNKCGNIEWLITETIYYQDSNPIVPNKEFTIRTLYQLVDGKVVVSDFCKEDEVPDIVLRDEQVIAGLSRIPFVLVGIPSKSPWWFDDVEFAQCQILNLKSLHHETLFDATYPQMVVSDSAVSKIDVKLRQDGVDGNDIARITREIIKGRKNPMVESAEENGVTRYIQPDSTCYEMMTNEDERLRKLMFENVGLSLFNRETRQIQSADSKQFDQLDTSSTLRHRALMLQKAESDLVDISKEVDPYFQEWEPVYPKNFDVFDSESASRVLEVVANIPGQLVTIQKMTLIASIKMLQSITNFPKDLVDQALEEVDNMVIDDGEQPNPNE